MQARTRLFSLAVEDRPCSIGFAFGRRPSQQCSCGAWRGWRRRWTDETSATTQDVFYEDAVKEILDAKCVRCHNASTQEAGLDLSSPQGLLHGGDSGRLFDAGRPGESLLQQKLDAAEMPPPEEPEQLAQGQADSVRQWIAAGAKFRQAVTTEPAITQHDILPLLYLRCVACHGGRRQEAGLDLRSKQSILKGGKSGPAVIAGKPDESLIMRRIEAGEMPPRRQLVSVSVKPMEAHEISKLAKWIALGLPEAAAEDGQNDPPLTEQDRSFWSFQPPQRQLAPRVEAGDRVRNPIDAFILRDLEQRGLTLSPEADRTTLLRTGVLRPMWFAADGRRDRRVP